MSSKIDITAVYTRENKPLSYLRRERFERLIKCELPQGTLDEKTDLLMFAKGANMW